MPLIRTKLHLPPPPPDLVPRTRLLDKLENGRFRPLTLVSAPAGYGKSTLVSSWLHTCDSPSAWLSLDENDNDFRLFLSYLLEAIQNLFPDGLSDSLALVHSSTLPPVDVLAASLVNELDQIEQDFILVLDDVHLIKDKSWENLFASLLRHPPRFVHFVMIGRKDPFQPVSRLRARNQVTEIRVQDLRFSTAETATYLRHVLKGPVDETKALDWTKRTEGWVTGLRLAVLAIRRQHDVSVPPDLQGNTQYITEYLFNEVLSNQSQVVREYLLSTAILDRFTAPLCDVVCGLDLEEEPAETDGWGFIDLLQQDNLFIINLDPEHMWFRYHHLFRELLQKKLERHRTPEEIKASHKRASVWFAENGLLEEAIQHALAAGATAYAAQVVEQNRSSVLDDDQWHVLERWLDLLRNRIRQPSPELLLAQAWVSFHQLNLQDIPSILESAERILGSDKPDHPLRGEIDFFRGYLCYFQGQGTQSEEYHKTALDLIPETHLFMRAEGELHFALARHMNGKKESAIDRLNSLIRSKSLAAGIWQTRLWAGIGFIQLLEGNLPEALQAGRQVYDIAEKGSLRYAESWGSYLEACICFSQNDLNNALRHFLDLAADRYSMHSRVALDTLSALSYVYQIRRHPDKAQETIELLLEFARGTGDPGCLSIASACQARTALFEGDLASAISWMRTADLTQDEGLMLWWIEVPRITECRVLIAEGSEAGLRMAEHKLLVYAHENSAIHNYYQVVVILSLLALVYKEQNRIDEALRALTRALELAEPGGFIRPFLEMGQTAVDLLKTLTKDDGRAKYATDVLSAFKGAGSSVSSEETKPQTFPTRSLSSQPLEKPLTNRQIQILEMLAQGLQNKEIGEKLHISPDTVRSHLRNIFSKLSVSSRLEAVAKATSLGILTSP